MSDSDLRPVTLVELFYELIFSTFVIDILATPFWNRLEHGLVPSLTVFAVLACGLGLFWAYQVRIRVNADLNGLQALLGFSVDLIVMFILIAGMVAQPVVSEHEVLLIIGLLLLALCGQLLFTAWRAFGHQLFWPLITAAALWLIAAWLPLAWGLALATLGILDLGAGLTHQTRHTTQALTPLLSRYSVLVILIIGQSMVRTAAAAQLSVINLAIIALNVLLFAIDVLIISGIDLTQPRRGLAIYFLHLPVILGVMLVEESLSLWLAGAIPNEWNAWLVWSGLSLFMISLFWLLSLYHRPNVDTGRKRWFYLGFSLLILAFFGAVTVTLPVIYLIGTSAYLVATGLYLYQFMLNAPKTD